MEKKTLKHLYHEMKQRIRVISGLMKDLEKQNYEGIHRNETLTHLCNLVNSLMGSAQFESPGSHRDALVDILVWTNAALNTDYLKTHSVPDTMAMVKKGLDLAFDFLHRDLRLKQMSAPEEEAYRQYLKIRQELPDPCSQRLAQGDVDDMVSALLKMGS